MSDTSDGKKNINLLLNLLQKQMIIIFTSYTYNFYNELE